MFSEAICMSNHTIHPCVGKKFGQVMHFTVSVLIEGSNMIFHSLTFARKVPREVLKTGCFMTRNREKSILRTSWRKYIYYAICRSLFYYSQQNGIHPKTICLINPFPTSMSATHACKHASRHLHTRALNTGK